GPHGPAPRRWRGWRGEGSGSAEGIVLALELLEGAPSLPRDPLRRRASVEPSAPLEASSQDPSTRPERSLAVLVSRSSQLRRCDGDGPARAAAPEERRRVAALAGSSSPSKEPTPLRGSTGFRHAPLGAVMRTAVYRMRRMPVVPGGKGMPATAADGALMSS